MTQGLRQRLAGAGITLACALMLLAGTPASASANGERVVCPPALPTQADSATTPRDRGFLWKATRDGRSLYLFGILHVGKPNWRRLGPQTAAALRASDVLALEIDPSDPELQRLLAEMRMPTSLPDDLQRRLRRAFERACMAPEALASLHPVLQATTLTVMEARWLGMDSSYAMEQVLMAQGKAQGRRVVALESVADQIKTLVPDDEAEARSLLDQSLQQLEDRSARRVLEKLMRAWDSGNLETFENYERWCECAASEADKAYFRKLNDERNPAMADGIERLHRQGGRVFAAVGALHMTGPVSLPLLLAQRGFKVERLHFKP